MKPQSSTSVGPSGRGVRPSSSAARSGWLLALLLVAAGTSVLAAESNPPVLQFIEPTNHAIFSTRDEVPILLRAYSPIDAFLTARVLANQQPIGTATYCCPFCPCWHPQAGDETTLQIAVPWENGMRPARTWQGWTNIQAGSYRLTAVATGENGTVVQATPVNITVLDLSLRIFVGSDGSVNLVIPQGSLVTGGYDAEISQDLRTWTRLGPFQPGNVAAFYFDPPANFRERRFYRSVWVPPRLP